MSLRPKVRLVTRGDDPMQDIPSHLHEKAKEIQAVATDFARDPEFDTVQIHKVARVQNQLDNPHLDDVQVDLIVAHALRQVRDDAQPMEPPEPVAAPTTGSVMLDPVDEVLVDVNQDNVALIFAKKYGPELRYSHDRGRWYRWDGTRWREETTRLAFEYTRRLTRALNKDGKREFAKASFCEGVEKFAQADRALAMTGTEWDSDPWLLNTPNGTVDLRTGSMRPARQTDLLTKITAIAPRSGVATQWTKFLRQITQGDGELIGFLQRMAGYALTGDTREECLFFVYGPGGNGKGTFLGAIFNIMAEFAMNAAMDVFLQAKGERHSTDLAMLRGARLVTASETSEGRAWDEQRLKAMTGNDPITARFMRQDNFTYQPQFKLILVGNNKPVLRTVDDAWRRRFHVIPFTFRPETRDITLKDRLRAEYPQILAWMIDGCLDWQRNGLQPPQRVQDETLAYFEAQDIFQSWVEDCCVCDTTKVALIGDLFRSWAAYCEKHREPSGTSRGFSDRLASRGFRRVRNSHGINGRGFLGLSVIPFSHIDAG
jgi:putative DNA primase/helicase